MNSQTNEALWEEFLVQTRTRLLQAHEDSFQAPDAGMTPDEYFNDQLIYDVKIRRLTNLLAEAEQAQLEGKDCMIWRLSYED